MRESERQRIWRRAALLVVGLRQAQRQTPQQTTWGSLSVRSPCHESTRDITSASAPLCIWRRATACLEGPQDDISSINARFC